MAVLEAPQQTPKKSYVRLKSFPRYIERAIEEALHKSRLLYSVAFTLLSENDETPTDGITIRISGVSGWHDPGPQIPNESLEAGCRVIYLTTPPASEAQWRWCANVRTRAEKDRSAHVALVLLSAEYDLADEFLQAFGALVRGDKFFLSASWSGPLMSRARETYAPVGKK